MPFAIIDVVRAVMLEIGRTGPFDPYQLVGHRRGSVIYTQKKVVGRRTARDILGDDGCRGRLSGANPECPSQGPNRLRQMGDGHSGLFGKERIARNDEWVVTREHLSEEPM